jgi:hypothetical protein
MVPHARVVRRSFEDVAMETVDWISLIALAMVAILVLPGALARNRRTWLPYMAVWLAVIVGLVWLYQTFGPF